MSTTTGGTGRGGGGGGDRRGGKEGGGRKPPPKVAVPTIPGVNAPPKKQTQPSNAAPTGAAQGKAEATTAASGTSQSGASRPTSASGPRPHIGLPGYSPAGAPVSNSVLDTVKNMNIGGTPESLTPRSGLSRSQTPVTKASKPTSSTPVPLEHLHHENSALGAPPRSTTTTQGSRVRTSSAASLALSDIPPAEAANREIGGTPEPTVTCTQFEDAVDTQARNKAYNDVIAEFKPSGIPNDDQGRVFAGYHGLEIRRLPRIMTQSEKEDLFSIFCPPGTLPTFVEGDMRTSRTGVKSKDRPKVTIKFNSVQEAIHACLNARQQNLTVQNRKVTIEAGKDYKSYADAQRPDAQTNSEATEGLSFPPFAAFTSDSGGPAAPKPGSRPSSAANVSIAETGFGFGEAANRDIGGTPEGFKQAVASSEVVSLVASSTGDEIYDAVVARFKPANKDMDRMVPFAGYRGIRAYQLPPDMTKAEKTELRRMFGKFAEITGYVDGGEKYGFTAKIKFPNPDKAIEAAADVEKKQSSIRNTRVLFQPDFGTAIYRAPDLVAKPPSHPPGAGDVSVAKNVEIAGKSKPRKIAAPDEVKSDLSKSIGAPAASTTGIVPRVTSEEPAAAVSEVGTHIPARPEQNPYRFGEKAYSDAIRVFKPQGIPPRNGFEFLGYRGIQISGLPSDMSGEERSWFRARLKTFGGPIKDEHYDIQKGWGNIAFTTVELAISVYLELRENQHLHRIRGTRWIKFRENQKTKMYAQPKPVIQAPVPAPAAPAYVPPIWTAPGNSSNQKAPSAPLPAQTGRSDVISGPPNTKVSGSKPVQDPAADADREARDEASSLFKPRGVKPLQDGREFVGYDGIHISSIPVDITDEETHKILGLISPKFGKIKRMHFGSGTGWGVIQLETIGAAIDAFLHIKESKPKIRGMIIDVTKADVFKVRTAPRSTPQTLSPQTMPQASKKSLSQAPSTPAAQARARTPVIVHSDYRIEVTDMSPETSRASFEAVMNRLAGRKGGIRFERVYDSDGVHRSHEAQVPFSGSKYAEIAIELLRRDGLNGRPVGVARLY